MNNKKIPNLTKEQDQQIRKLCLKEHLTFFKAFQKIVPIYNHIFMDHRN